jgi:hypothetical protein
MAGVPEPVWSFDDVRTHVPSYGWIRDYVAYALQCTDAPPMYHVMAATALAINAIAAEHNCVVDGEPIPLHDYFLIIGESGTRKTAAIRRALRLVKRCYMQAQLGHRIWYPEACTPEGIALALEEDPNRLMVLYEWSDLHASGRASYWQHAPQFWELIFDQQPMQRLKIAKSVSIERPSVTILGASTPSLVKQHTSLHDWQAGKMARYLIGYQAKPDDKEMTHPIERPDLLEDLHRNYERLLSTSLVTSFSPSEAAKEYKNAWQYSSEWKEFVRSLPEHLKPSGLRASDHIYRIATAYQASIDYPDNFVISESTIAVAIQFVWWCLESVRDTFSMLNIHESQPLTRVRAVLGCIDSLGIARGELLRQTHLHGPELDRAVATLLECEQVKIVRHKGTTIYVPRAPSKKVQSLGD